MIDITSVVTAILALIGAAITTYLIPWIKSKTTAEQRRIAQMIVRTAVYAAEQLFVGEDRGTEKLAYVQKRLEEAKIKLDVEAIRDMIEEAVLELAIKREWGITEEDPKEDDPKDVFEETTEPVELDEVYKPPEEDNG